MMLRQFLKHSGAGLLLAAGFLLVAGTAAAALDCGSAVEVTLDSVTGGNTTGGVNLVSTYPCGPWDESGPEQVFHLSVATPTMWSADLVSLAGDELDLVLLIGCDEVTGCQIVVDSSVASSTLSMGDFYLVVDGRDGAAGPFELRITTEDPPVGPCETFLPAFLGDDGESVPVGTYDISGDTCDSSNQIDALACTDFALLGKDEFLEVVLLPDAMLTVSVTSSTDAALWLLDVCDGFTDANCLALADATYAGQTETLTWMNSTGERARLWLVIDSWGTDTCGTFTGTLDLMNEGAVSVDKVSWDALRALYR